MKIRNKLLSLLLAMVLWMGFVPQATFAQTTNYNVQIQGEITSANALFSKLGPKEWSYRATSNRVTCQYYDFKNATITGTSTSGAKNIILGSYGTLYVVYNTQTQGATTQTKNEIDIGLQNGTKYDYGVASQQVTKNPSISMGPQKTEVYYGSTAETTFDITSQDLDRVGFEWTGNIPVPTIVSSTKTGLTINTIPNTPAGKYPFKVIGVSGNQQVEVKGEFIVKKADSKMIFKEGEKDEIEVGQPIPLSINVSGKEGAAKPTGTVSFATEDGMLIAKDVEIKDGQACIQWETTCVGKKKVIATYSGDKNYNSRQGSTEIDIGKLEQSIHIADLGEITYGDTFTLSLSEQGEGSGAVTYTSDNPSIISIKGNTAKVLGVGEVFISAEKEEDDTFYKISDKARLKVNPKKITLEVNNDTIAYGEELPTFTYNSERFNEKLVNGDTVSTDPLLSSPNYEGKIGKFDIEASGVVIKNDSGEDVTSCYDITYKKGKLLVVSPLFTIETKAQEGGTITTTGSTTVMFGEDRTFTITPKTGYKIVDVKVDGNSQGTITTYTFTNIQKSHTIDATFEKISTPTNDAKINTDIKTDTDTKTDTKTLTNTPDTRDGRHFPLWIGLLSLAVIGIITTAVYKRHK